MYAFNLRTVSKAALVAVAALSFSACDSSGVDDADLDDIKDEFRCDNVRAISPTADLNGELTTSDCDDDGNYFDLYAFRIDEDSDIDITVTSEEYDLEVCLVNDRGNALDCEFADRRDDADIEFDDLDDGTYGILIVGDDDETGRYTGRLTSRASR